MDDYRFRVQLLDTLVEDYTSLSSILAAFAQHLRGGSDEQHLQHAHRFVAEVVRDGLAEVLIETVSQARMGRRSLRVLEGAERCRAVAPESLYWRGPTRESDVVVAATPKGERALIEGTFSNS